MNTTKEECSIKEWWEMHHQNKDNFFLTGSKGPEVWDYLKIQNLIFEGQTVLNIGVGLGFCTEELVRRDCRVHVLDISEAALDRVSGIVEKTWRIEQFDLENIFDLIVSNLVTQHMNNEDLTIQLNKVIPSLKKDGLFAMQFAFRLDGKISSKNENLHNMKVGGVCRSLEEMDEIVKKSGGRIIWSQKIGKFPQYGSGWFAIHIKKIEGGE